MAPFRPGANARYRAALAGLAGLAFGIVIAPFGWQRHPTAGAAPEQPVPFDHGHHVRDRGIDCVYCHATVETDAAAGMPAMERCVGCHRLLKNSTQMLGDLWATKTPVRWRRVTALPAHVYFHHGVHTHAGVACAECHGDVENEARVSPAHAMTMTFCLDCHRRVQGSRAITPLTTCSGCHR